MINLDENFLQKVVEVWQPDSQVPLTLEDAREIVFDLKEFVTLLGKWSKEANE